MSRNREIAERMVRRALDSNDIDTSNNYLAVAVSHLVDAVRELEARPGE
ncbi:hypothetical protein LRM64_10125 [Prescottella equi]|nr:hypothetical protein [Prescottella equi]MBM4592253.1 hypothetical protein [Prescottella equi]MCU7531903.1 hypothetical protein [Prescottella equi]MCU7534035.1 hypothetical protein [Prescottella equi]NKW13284.1 hypothetical protein [Prescottella equi]